MKDRIKLNKEGKDLEEVLGMDKGSIDSLDERLQIMSTKLAHNAIDKMDANNPSIFINIVDVVEGLMESFTEQEILTIASSYIVKRIAEPFDSISKKVKDEPSSALDKMLEEMAKFK